MDFSNPYNIIEIPLIELLRNLFIGVLMAYIWAFSISKNTRLIVDTTQYYPIFLLLIPSMIIIITIIKSSIALSLGLVGALSIVRFRTPIKEPEELLYIFVAIAVGLGLGANQVASTVLGFVVVLLVMIPIKKRSKSNRMSDHCFIDFIIINEDSEHFSLAEFDFIVEKNNLNSKLKRFVEVAGRYEITIELTKLDLLVYDSLRKELKEKFKNIEISIMDNSRVIT
jgi:hypothetical protein